MKQIFNIFIEWLFSPNRTEKELHKIIFISNYLNTCFKEYILNFRKSLIESLIIKT